MTENECRLIRTCLANGYEFHKQLRGIVIVGGEEYDADEFEKLIVEVDELIREKQNIGK